MNKYIKNLLEQTQSVLKESIVADAAKLAGVEEDVAADAIKGLNFASYLELGNAVSNEDGELVRELLNIDDIVPADPIEEAEQMDLDLDDYLDMTDELCQSCRQGFYTETSIQDDMQGVLHCDDCGVEVTRYQRIFSGAIEEGATQECQACSDGYRSTGLDPWGETCVRCGGRGRLTMDGDYIDDDDLSDGANESKLAEATIARYDAWALEDVNKNAIDLVNKAIDRCGDDLSPDNIIRKIRTGWRGLNPAVVNAAIAMVKKEAGDLYEDNKLLDKPTPTVRELAKKHNVPSAEIASQLAKGIKAEKEHTSDARVAKEIALDHLNEFPDYYDRLKKVEEADNPSAPAKATPAATPPSAGSSIDALAKPTDTAGKDDEEQGLGRKSVDDLQIGDQIEVADIDGQPAAGRVRNVNGPGNTIVVTGKGKEEHMIRKDSILSTPMMDVTEGENARKKKTKIGQKMQRAERVEKKRQLDIDEANASGTEDLVNCPECHGKGSKKYPHQGEMEWDSCWTCDGAKKMSAKKAKRFESVDEAIVDLAEMQATFERMLSEAPIAGAEGDDVKSFKQKLKDPTQYYIRREYHIGKTPYRDFKATVIDAAGGHDTYKVSFTDDRGEQISTWYPAPGTGALSGRFYDERLIKAGEKGKYVGGDSRANWPPVPVSEGYGEETHADMVEYWKQSLSQSIVRKGVFTQMYDAAGQDIDELNAVIADEAESIADRYHGSGEGIGSSDVNHFIAGIARQLGIEDVFGWDKPREPAKFNPIASDDEMERDKTNRYAKYNTALRGQDGLPKAGDVEESRNPWSDSYRRSSRNTKGGPFKSKAVGSTVKVIMGDHEGKVGTISRAEREQYLSWSPFVIYYGIDFEDGSRGYVRRESTRKIKKGNEVADQTNEAASKKLACTKCDEVSTQKAWEKNDGSCPKCNNSTQGVAESFKNRIFDKVGDKVGTSLGNGTVVDIQPMDNRGRQIVRVKMDKYADHDGDTFKFDAGDLRPPTGVAEGRDIKQKRQLRVGSSVTDDRGQSGEVRAFLDRSYKGTRVAKVRFYGSGNSGPEFFYVNVDQGNRMLESIDEARNASNTEHAGAKKGKGGYYGRKQDAKSDSNKKRRENDKKAVDETTRMKQLAGLRVDEVKSGNFNSRMIGQRVKIVSQEDSFGRNHFGEEGVITRASREHTFSQMVPFIIEYGVKLDNGERITIRREHVRKVKQVTEDANSHQKKIAIDTVRNPNKSWLGGPSAKEAEDTLRNKFGYTDKQIAKLKETTSAGAVAVGGSGLKEDEYETGSRHGRNSWFVRNKHTNKIVASDLSEKEATDMALAYNAEHEGVNEGLQFWVEPLANGIFEVRNSEGDIHDVYDSGEEAVRVATDLNAQYGEVDESYERMRTLAGLQAKQVTETASGGATGAGAIASSPTALGGVQSRNASIYGQTTLRKKPTPKKRPTRENTGDGIGRSKKE